MTATAPQDAAAGSTVALPVGLAPLAAFLVELGARQVTQQGGTRSALLRLGELQGILRAAARGTPERKMAARARAEELTTSQAADVMGISARRVRELARTRRIVSRKAGRDWLIDAGSARSWRNA